MESAANFHHQFQDQLVLDSPPPCYGASTNHSWNPNAFLSSSHNLVPTDNNLVPAAVGNNPMIQELVGFHCATANNHGGTNPGAGINFSTAHDRFQLGARNTIKDELSEPYPAKFTEMINSPPSSSIEDLHLHPSNFIKNDPHHQRYNGQLNPIGATFSNHGCDIKGNLVNHHFPPGEFVYANYNSTSDSQSSCSGITTSTRGGFSQIYPTVNVSCPNTNNLSASVPSSLDLFNSARFSAGFARPSFDINGTNLGGVFKDTCLSYGLDEMQQLSHRPTDNPSKITGLSSYINGGAQGKRSSENMDRKGKQITSMTPIKKSRVESRSSCPPFKVIIQVRKEKLGDRIAALQQLVAPFGKTDTASVLMEAIGYIKFLQNQVEKLSVPYIKTSRAGRGGSVDDGHEEARRDLKSRGLCLVPLSCLSYVTDGGGGIWPNP